jgi:quercetin dioxygenase-like cupin family protein
VIDGSAVHVEEGKEDRVYTAGEAFVIGKGRVHAPRTTDQPARAIVFRVHVEGEPERELVE